MHISNHCAVQRHHRLPRTELIDITYLHDVKLLRVLENHSPSNKVSSGGKTNNNLEYVHSARGAISTMASSNEKVALVVGASRGIGRQIAIDLAKNGYAGE